MRIDCGYYSHHMMVVEVIDSSHVRVIHYTGVCEDATKAAVAEALMTAISSTSSGQSEIIEEKVEINLGNATVELLRYAHGVALYTGAEAIKRARSRLNEKQYNLATNNCECFINWAITGKSESGQVNKAVGMAAVGVGLAVGVAAVGGMLYTLFGGKKKQND